MSGVAPRSRRPGARLAATLQWGLCYVVGSALIVASLLVLGDALPW